MARKNGLKMMPLNTVADRLKAERAACEDEYHYLMDPQIELQNPHAEIQDRFQLRFGGTDGAAVAFSETSIGQFCRVVGLPAYVLERLPPSLGLNVLRCMSTIAHERKPVKYLFRLRPDRQRLRLRALLQGSYVRFDDELVMEHVLKNTKEMKLRVAHVNITDDLFSLRLLHRTPHNIGTSKARDEAHTGFDIRTSETGRYDLQVRQLLYRVICSNGMTELINDKSNRVRRTTSRGREDIARLLDQAMLGSHNRAQVMATRLGEMRSVYLQHPFDEVGRIFEDYRLGSPQGRTARRVREHLVPQVGLLGARQFDIVQAFTAVAQQLDHDWRPRLEDAMGAYVLQLTEEDEENTAALRAVVEVGRAQGEAAEEAASHRLN